MWIRVALQFHTMLNRDIIAKDRVFLYSSCLTTHWLLLGLQDYVSTDATCPMLGDKKSLSLMDSKDKDNHFSTCCDTIVFFSFLQVKCPFSPLWGGRCNGQWGLRDTLLAKGHLPATIRLLLQYWYNFRNSRPSPLEYNGQFWWPRTMLKWQSGSHFSDYLSKGRHSWATWVQSPSNKYILWSDQFYGHLAIRCLSKATHFICSVVWSFTF